jgi:hypothetical protein
MEIMRNLIKTMGFQIKLSVILTLFSVFFLAGGSSAQSSQGTEFWVCFPDNYDGAGSRKLFITSELNAVVNVNVVNPAFATVVNVPAGTLSTITMPAGIDITTNGVVENKGIHITSDNPITVYGMSENYATSDAYLALPVDALGTNYLVMSYTYNVLPSQMTIVASEDNTAVTITPTASGGGFTAGVPGNVVLNEGQTLNLKSNDYTGSLVVSDKPVSVFGGVECVNVPTGVGACDFIVEQMTPTSSWGQSFVTIPLATRSAGDIFRFMAKDNATQVSVNGGVVANLNQGQYYETSLASGTYNRITANKPILVGQYCKGSSADGATADPFFALVPPDEQFLNNYVISAGTPNIPNNFLNITSPTANTANVLVDGVPVNAGLWNPIPSTTFSGATVPIASGIHTVSSVLPIGLLVYGYGFYDSYGYLGGQAFAAVATITSIEITPKTGSGQTNINRCWEVEVLNNLGDPVTGVRVDFTITGANPGSGFAFTNANGIATYCYTGTNPGQDVIVANVGALSDTAAFTWTDQPVDVPLSNWALFIGLFLIIGATMLRFRRS